MLSFLTLTNAVFYQADTMARYCEEYIKYINLESNVDQYEAGVCSGYISSKIEVMELSEQLCHKDKLNLNNVVKEFILTVKDNNEAKEQSATYVVVQVLQQNFSCDE